jgi:uncharacterized RDD family membrane protein YckC
MKKCSYCGRESQEDATHCGECGTEIGESDSPPEKLTSAGFGIRGLARIIDTIFAMLVTAYVGVGANIIMPLLSSVGILPPGWHQRLHGLSLTGVLLGVAGVILYHFFCEGLSGVTIGKLCCGICVVSEDGHPCTMKGALIRSLAYYIDGQFFGLLGYESMRKSPLNQRYGDKWGKTAVFKTREIPLELRWTSGRLVFALALGTAALGGFVGLDIIQKAWG